MMVISGGDIFTAHAYTKRKCAALIAIKVVTFKISISDAIE